EFNQGFLLNWVDEFVYENLTREVHHFPGFLFVPNILTDRLHQVGFAQSDSAIDKEWVIGASRRLRHGQARRMRDLIVRTDNEGLEGIARVQAHAGTDGAG